MAHVKAHYRFVNGKSVYVPEHDDARPQGRAAELHERTAIGKHRSGSTYLRATDAEDGRAIEAAAQKLGHGFSKKRAGGNHHGRVGAYDHYHFDDPAHAAAVHAELKKQAAQGQQDHGNASAGGNPPNGQQAEPTPAAETPVQKAERLTNLANQEGGATNYRNAASAHMDAADHPGADRAWHSRMADQHTRDAERAQQNTAQPKPEQNTNGGGEEHPVVKHVEEAIDEAGAGSHTHRGRAVYGETLKAAKASHAAVKAGTAEAHRKAAELHANAAEQHGGEWGAASKRAHAAAKAAHLQAATMHLEHARASQQAQPTMDNWSLGQPKPHPTQQAQPTTDNRSQAWHSANEHARHHQVQAGRVTEPDRKHAHIASHQAFQAEANATQSRSRGDILAALRGHQAAARAHAVSAATRSNTPEAQGHNDHERTHNRRAAELQDKLNQWDSKPTGTGVDAPMDASQLRRRMTSHEGMEGAVFQSDRKKAHKKSQDAYRAHMKAAESGEPTDIQAALDAHKAAATAHEKARDARTNNDAWQHHDHYLSNHRQEAAHLQARLERR